MPGSLGQVRGLAVRAPVAPAPMERSAGRWRTIGATAPPIASRVDAASPRSIPGIG